MKAPLAGGLRALRRSSSINNSNASSSNNNKRKSNRRASSGAAVATLAHLPAQTIPFLADWAAPAVALAILLAACFVVPQPAVLMRLHPGGSLSAFWFLAELLLLAAVSAFWIYRLRSRFDDARYKRFILRLVFSVPAFAGVMAARAIYGSDLGGHGVVATIGAAGVIASALLVATVIGRSASTLMVAVMAAVMGLTGIFPAWATAAAALGAIAGQYPARALRNRTAVVRCATIVMLTAGLSACVAALLIGRDLAAAASIGMQALLTGCLGAAVWFTLLTIMERPFQLTTPLGLLEMLDPTRPILERFAREAPGTFAHSLMVGHLAASAAEAVGADPLLCRVAAQYHDIGKLCRAHFFKENQQGENVHDQLTPSLSAIIVNSHVRDGERMANELGLPPVIRDIITQHHGTTLMRYFYYRATAGAEPRSASALQSQFRYPGPKPQTKEAGIMMLADAVEAASRTLTRPTKERIRAMVDEIVDDRLEDRQLDECPLTLRDIQTIRETLTEIVRAMLHDRVEYPGAICAETSALPSEPSAATPASSDFYENFDPAVLLTLSDTAEQPQSRLETGRAAHRPFAKRFASGGESASRPTRRRAQRLADR